MSTSTTEGWKFDSTATSPIPARSRLPDLRDRHQGRLVDAASRRSGSACTAAASASSTRTATRSPGREQARGDGSRLIGSSADERSRPRPDATRPASGSSRVSMCNHDIYGGGDQPDPNNPNTTPDGKPRTVNGLFATKAAIAFAEGAATRPRRRSCTAGARARGRLGVAWGMQEEGVPPPASSPTRAREPPVGGGAGASRNLRDDGRGIGAIAARCIRRSRRREPARPADRPRRHDRADPPHLEPADPNVCGDTPMTCTLADGSTTTMGSTDCSHEPIRRAIAGQGAGAGRGTCGSAWARRTRRAAARAHGHQQGRLRTPTRPRPPNYDAAIAGFTPAGRPVGHPGPWTPAVPLFSTTIAMPWPTPMHIVARPSWASSRR